MVENPKNKEILVKYDEIIRKQCKDGIIELADTSKRYLHRPSVMVHYLPHHPVIKESSSTTKLRVVYEGNAKLHTSQKSLNECLYQGPNMIANLIGILLRFRMNVVALVADIQKAYLQLQLKPVDRDVTRFLWVKDVHRAVSNDNIQVMRFCRVIWGIISSGFLLACTIYHHLLKYDS